MNAPSPFWQLLFAPEAATLPALAVPMKLLTKRGQPLLLLPAPPHLAGRGLELYPAQTMRGRLLRTLAGWALQARLPFGVTSVPVALTPDDAFIRWLAGLAGLAPGIMPQFAALAGNPNSPGQRFILMLFDPAGTPVAVVKVGVTEAARRLIAQEAQFLETVPITATGIPKLRGTFANSKIRALALDFFPGHSPRASEEQALPQVLGNWLRPQTPIVVADTRSWRELRATCANHPVFTSLAVSLRHLSCAGALVHGDFTPWNIRVSPSGDWNVVDWERGELNGVPALDWFHYQIQKSILVQHQPVAALVDAAERLLSGNEFKAYAQAAGLRGQERSLLLFYLLYQAEVIRPAEGLAATRALLNRLAARWG